MGNPAGGQGASRALCGAVMWQHCRGWVRGDVDPNSKRQLRVLAGQQT